MKLYSNRFAPSPRRVRMFAAEKGIALEIVEIDIAARENDGAAFRALSPRGLLPVLVLDDGTALPESLAICRYLEEMHPEPNLLGTTPRERAAIEACVQSLMYELYVPSTHVFRHTHKFWAGRLAQVAAYGELARAQVTAEWDALERTLTRAPWLAAGRLTQADLVAYTSVDFAKVFGLRVGPDRPALETWYRTLAARPSAQA